MNQTVPTVDGSTPVVEIGHDDHGEDEPMLVHTFERELIHTDRARRFEQAAAPRTPRAPRRPRYLADALMTRLAFWRRSAGPVAGELVSLDSAPSNARHDQAA